MKIYPDVEKFTTLVYSKSFLLSMQDMHLLLEDKIKELGERNIKLSKQTTKFVQEIIDELKYAIKDSLAVYKQTLEDMAETAGYTLTNDTRVTIDNIEYAITFSEPETNTTANADVNTNQGDDAQ